MAEGDSFSTISELVSVFQQQMKDQQEQDRKQMEAMMALVMKTSPESASGRHFITLQQINSGSIFHTEEWQSNGSALFVPLAEDLMINTRNIEQFSCSCGSFFVAGSDGVYSKTITGEVLHLWRFCQQQRKLFISRSFLFTNSQEFSKVQQVLQRL